MRVRRSKGHIMAGAFLVAAILGVGAYLILDSTATKEPPRQVAASDRVVFAAAGDFGASDQARQVMRLAGGLEIDHFLALGDFSYNEVPEREWCELVQKEVGERIPFQLVVGNHDVDTEGAQTDVFSDCLPNRLGQTSGVYPDQYSFVRGDKLLKTIVISPDLTINGRAYDYSPGTPDRQWLEAELASARAAGVQWVTVAMHENCLTIGEKDCEIGQELFDYLVKQRVDLVLQGHEHGYMRSKQLTTNDQCSEFVPTRFLESCVSNSDSSFVKGQGPVLAIVGTGGIAIRDVFLDRPEAPYFEKWYGKNADPLHGVLQVEVTPGQLRATLLDTDQQVRDTFVIKK